MTRAQGQSGETGGELQVGIVMGSDSDLGVMQHAGRALSAVGLVENIHFEYAIPSAHRTPEDMARYAKQAGERGLQVVIAGAGGSAHLPGMLASEVTDSAPIPVLGVAITGNTDVMNRALGSMIGMPEGTPLAVLGQNESGAFNAGLFAARILSATNHEVREAYNKYVAKMKTSVRVKSDRLRDMGATDYLEDLARRKREAEQY